MKQRLKNNKPICIKKEYVWAGPVYAHNRGITLVALIITIIVLLILAVVAISAVTGNGILNHAQNAKNSYEISKIEEGKKLDNFQKYILEYVKDNDENNDEAIRDTNLDEQTISMSDGTIWSAGSGTQNNPFVIENEENLLYLAKQVNSGEHYTNVYFILENSIDFSSYNEWIPIGNNSDRYFDGMFDGRGMSIVNIVTSGPYNYRGLFGFTGENSKISNLTIEVSIIGSETTNINGNFTGAVVGYNKGLIGNCYVKDAYLYGENYLGGIAGYNKGLIEDCHVSGIYLYGEDYSGGITGYNTGTITNCESKENSISGRNYLGGLTGYNAGKEENCTQDPDTNTITKK